jgi:YVTN family beta-propeller protein
MDKNHDINKNVHIVKNLVTFTELLVLFLVIGSSLATAYAGFPEENKPMEQKIYVSNNIEGTISVINTANNTVIDTIPAGDGPFYFAISPDHTKVYLDHCCGKNYTWIIDTTTNQPIANISLPDYSVSVGIVFKPDGTKYYLVNNKADMVWVFSATNNEIINTIPVGSRPYGIAISPDGTRAYVTNLIGNTVSVIDTAINQVIGTVNVGNSPLGVVVSPDGKKVYIANGGSGSGDVSIIDTAINQVIGTVNVGDHLHDVAVSPDGKKVYVTKNDDLDKGNVSVINTTTNKVITNITVGNIPYSIVFTPDGTTAYVTNANSNTVSVIDVATDNVMDTISVGKSPIGVVVIPAIQIPALKMVKSAYQTSYDNVGQTITYTFTVTNSGNADIKGPITVTDDKFGIVSIPNSDTLSKGSSVSGTATYKITDADIDAGSVSNLATATGLVNGNNVTSNNAVGVVLYEHEHHQEHPNNERDFGPNYGSAFALPMMSGSPVYGSPMYSSPMYSSPMYRSGPSTTEIQNLESNINKAKTHLTKHKHKHKNRSKNNHKTGKKSLNIKVDKK